MSRIMLERMASTGRVLARLLEQGRAFEISRHGTRVQVVVSKRGPGDAWRYRYYDGGTLDSCVEQLAADEARGAA